MIVSEWEHLTQVGVPVMRCVDGRECCGFAFLDSDVLRFLPTAMVAPSEFEERPALSLYKAEAQASEMLANLTDRMNGFQKDLVRLRRLMRDVSMAPDDSIRASLLSDFMRRNDPTGISEREARAIVSRRIEECEDDVAMISDFVAAAMERRNAHRVGQVVSFEGDCVYIGRAEDGIAFVVGLLIDLGREDEIDSLSDHLSVDDPNTDVSAIVAQIAEKNISQNALSAKGRQVGGF